MILHFNDRERWLQSCFDLMVLGATFDAWEHGMQKHCYTIELTGGY